MFPQVGFPTNLMQINLSDWASLVQDAAPGLQVLPPRLSNCLDPEILNLLHQLEAVTQVNFATSAITQEQTVDVQEYLHQLPYLMEPDYGTDSGIWMTASSSGVTTPSTSLGGMSGLVPPPPGISIWDPFQWKAPISQRPFTTLLYRPPTGRAKWLKATLSIRGLVPGAPQMAPAIRQPPLLSQS